MASLGGGDLADERSAVHLDEPRVLDGVRAQRPVQLAEHAVAPELEPGQQEVALAQQPVAVRPVLGGEGPGAQQHGREEQLELRLPELLVHLEADLLHDEEGAREVVLGAVLDEVRHQVVDGEVEDDLDGPVGTGVPGVLRGVPGDRVVISFPVNR